MGKPPLPPPPGENGAISPGGGQGVMDSLQKIHAKLNLPIILFFNSEKQNILF